MEIENPAIKFDYYLLEKNAALAIDLLYYTGTITLLVSITTDKYRPARIKSCGFQRCWVSSLLNVKKLQGGSKNGNFFSVNRSC